MDPMTMMMIATAASSLLGNQGGQSNSSNDQQNQMINPFQQRQIPELMGFPSMLKNKAKGG